MKALVVLVMLWSAAWGAQAAVLPHASVGAGKGIDQDAGSRWCPGDFLTNYDGSAEDGFAWQYGGIVPPYYGAFAECFLGDCIQGIQLKLTGHGYPSVPCDLYIWENGAGIPGTVYGIRAGYNPDPVATWPNISTHDFCFGNSIQGGGSFFAGFWADFSRQRPGYFVAADTNGFGGCPMTNVAPGIGYPTGWNNVSMVFSATQALGIGVYVTGLTECIAPPPPPSAVPPPPLGGEVTTWGRIKEVYQ